MTFQLSPYRVPHLCPTHAAAAAPPCPRCAADWLGPPEATGTPRVARRVFVAGIFAATVFGAVIGTAIGFVAGASPLWGSAAPQSSLRTIRVHAAPVAKRPSPHRPRPVPVRHVPTPLATSLAGARAAPIGPPFSAVTPLIARLGDRTSDPEILLARLQGLARSGVPLTIETRRLSRRARESLQGIAGLTRSVRLSPVQSDGRTVGLRVIGVSAGGALEEAGARSGDVLLAVNGLELGESRWPPLQPFPGDARALVVELERGGEHRILVLRW